MQDTSDKKPVNCLITDLAYLSSPHARARTYDWDIQEFTAQSTDGKNHRIWVLNKEHVLQNIQYFLKEIQRGSHLFSRLIIITEDDSVTEDFKPLPADLIFLILPPTTPEKLLLQAIDNAFTLMNLEFENMRLQSRLMMSHQDVRRLTDVGQALATERDFGKLIELILNKARELVSADGGSIYLSEKPPGGGNPTHIRFMRSALMLDAHEFLLPINRNSIAGYVALTGARLMIDDVYKIPESEPYSFNPEFDKTHNYYTKSMMIIPMLNHHNEVIGVIQLINRKKNFFKNLTVEEMKGDEVTSFSEKDYELLAAMAGQAAVAIENNALIKEIESLFEGFVKASVTAIESRDPTTSGHSFRVADYSVTTAMFVDGLRDGIFEGIKFSRQQIRELRYASLLHDFGKVGVREHVLVKAKKLYPADQNLIEWRFAYIKKSFEADLLARKMDEIRLADPATWIMIDKKYEKLMSKGMKEIEEMFLAIMAANEPTVLEEGSFDFLKKIAEKSINVPGIGKIPFLKENELLNLSIRKGTLNLAERKEIESHVTHTYNFLVQIPWTKDLGNVPEIAHGHHEKLNGKGYPLGINAPQITVQTRIMTIADIYDALTAWD
ncbi:MAG: GAF domain-containing protein, partial [Leptospiraceae bacterium]|nr:GAF domain-containing protein [Leptospiraceae bacterium]